MKIPTYDQRVVPQSEGTEVFALPGEQETVRRIPATGLATAQAKSKYYDVLFDIGTKIEEARDADAMAEAQKKANEEYSRIDEYFKDPKRQDPYQRDENGNIIKDKNGFDMNNPDYIPPELYKETYDKMSKKARERILENFGGRPRARTMTSRYLDDFHTREGVKVNTLARAKTVADMTERLYRRLDTRLEAASVAYNTGDKNAIVRLRAETEADIAGAVRAGLITPTQGSALQRSTEVKAVDAVMKTDINRAYNQGLEERNTNKIDEIISELDKPKKDDVMTENMRIDYKVMAERLKMSLEGKIEKLNREETETFLAKAEDALESAMVDYNDRSNLTAVKTFVNKLNTRIDGYVAKGVMTERQGQAIKKDFQNRAVYGVELSNIYLAYQAGVDKDNPKDGIENMNQLIERYETPSKKDIMTENQRVDLLFKAQSFKKRLDNAQSERDLLKQSQVQDMIKEQISNYRQNGVALHDELAIENAVTEAFGSKNNRNAAIMNEYRKEANEAKISYQVAEDIKTAPIQDITSAGYVESSVAKFSVEDRPKAISAMTTAINQKITHLSQDPVDYVIRNSEEVQSAAKEFNDLSNTQAIDIVGNRNELIKDKFDKLNSTLLKAQREQGVPESGLRLMTRAQAQEAVRTFKEGKAEDIMKQIDNLQIQYGDNYDIVYRDMQREKLPDGIQIAVSTTDRAHRNLQIEAIEAYKMKEDEFNIDKEVKQDINDILKNNEKLNLFRKSVIAQGGGSAVSQRRINSLESAIKKLGMYKAVKNNDTESADMWTEQAINEVIDAHYQFSDQGYRVPANTPLVEVEKEAYRLSDLFDESLLNESYQYPAELANKIRLRGVFINNKTDDGIDLTVDGIKIIGKDGQPIGLKFNNLYQYKDKLAGDVIEIGGRFYTPEQFQEMN